MRIVGPKWSPYVAESYLGAVPFEPFMPWSDRRNPAMVLLISLPKMTALQGGIEGVTAQILLDMQEYLRDRTNLFES